MGSACPADDVLEDLAAGRLSASAASAIRDHAPACERCSALLRELTATLGEPAVRRTPPSPTYPPGTVVGRFVLERKVGEGGMGAVFVAHDPMLDRKVAIKLLHRATTGSEGSAGAQARLTREAQAMAKLSHPNVVTIYEVGTHNEQVFLAMELVEGTNAKQWLEAHTRSWREVRDAFVDAGRGLAAAHAAGFVHRDFKPDNVLISPDGRVRVTDFGLARAVGTIGSARPKTADPTPVAASGSTPSPTPLSSPSSLSSPSGLLNSPITQEGAVVGTIAYMSPEQFAAGKIDPRSDVFSYCVTLYEALYGAAPPRDWAKIMPAAEPPVGSEVPIWLHAALLRGMETDPAKRFASMTELLSALTAEPEPPPPKRRATWIAVAAGVGLALAATAAVVALRPAKASVDSCDRNAKLDGIWDDAVRQKIATAFTTIGGAGGTEQWKFTEIALERYMRGWLDAGKSACEATRVTGDQSEAAMVLRLDCLDNELTAFRVLVEMLARPDQRLIDNAVFAVQSIAKPGTCADARSLSAQPNSHATKAQLDDIVARLERLAVRADVGDDKAALAGLTQLLVDVKKVDSPTLEVQVLDHLAASEASFAQYEVSLAHYKTALELAEASHLDLAAATAAAEVLAETALTGHPLAEVDALIDPTMKVVRRAGDSVALRQLTAHALGLVYSNTGRSQLAIEQFTKAVELTRKAEGADSLDEILDLNNLGASEEDVGRYDDALAAWHEGLEVEKRVLGRNRDSSAITWINLALTNGKLGHVEESEAAANHVVEISKRQGMNDFTALAMALTAIARADAGKTAEASDWLGKSEVLLAQLKAEATPDGSEVMRLEIEAAVALGRPAHAVELTERLLANDAPRLPADSAQWVPNLRVAGKAYLAAGQLAKARDALDRALKLAPGQPWYAGWVADMKYRLARALVGLGEQKVRADQLCREATDELATLPVRAKLHAEVAAWCANPR